MLIILDTVLINEEYKMASLAYVVSYLHTRPLIYILSIGSIKKKR